MSFWNKKFIKPVYFNKQIAFWKYRLKGEVRRDAFLNQKNHQKWKVPKSFGGPENLFGSFREQSAWYGGVKYGRGFLGWLYRTANLSIVGFVVAVILVKTILAEDFIFPKQ